jgi:magnesium chelatase subunit I
MASDADHDTRRVNCLKWGPMNSLPKNLGELRRSQWSEDRVAQRTVRQELRDNLLCKMEKGEALFQGVHGYEDTVVPQIINAILSRHHFILLGLRGQAKSRILRGLVGFMDDRIPYLEGCEIHDNPYTPLCRACRDRIVAEGDATPIAWLPRDQRYVEKLATPDVTIADMIGDIDPIKAARSGKNLSDELTIHYGLLPRANRGIFAINELPDLAGKIQVGLFNIMQEGDIQIKGYPVRLALDVLMVFTANPEDYTARGKIVTPLKDRIGSEIRTHYPATVAEGMSITEQESWLKRDAKKRVQLPQYIREIVEEVAFQAREDKRVDRRSGVSQRLPISALENVMSSAEQRAIRSRDSAIVARISDVYAAIPSMTGKFELEYEGELRGADNIARELIRAAVGKTYSQYFTGANMQPVIQWFELGGELKVPMNASSSEVLAQLKKIQGLFDNLSVLDVSQKDDAAIVTSAAEFILEGLWAHKRISRSEERGYFADARKTSEPRDPREPSGRTPRRQFN